MIKKKKEENVQEVIAIIDGWSGKLTWEALIKRVLVKLNRSYTRQGLAKHEEIQFAFEERKKVLRGSTTRNGKRVSAEDQVYVHKIERLEAEVERLKAENNNLKARFVQLANNAFNNSKREVMLDQHGEDPAILERRLIIPRKGQSPAKKAIK